jgi:teichuronic acid biosynthesis glycosyltransferase TuaH
MKKIDIAIIPHKVNEFTNSMNPLKLFEYLASGKPVITTGVAGTEDVSEYIYLANSKDEFVKTIKDVSIKIINGKISAENVVKSVDDKWLWDKKTNEIIDIIIHKSRNDYAKET